MLTRIPGSFRDPSGHVYDAGGKIYRSVSRSAAAEYEAARDSELLNDLVRAGKLVTVREADSGLIGQEAADVAYVLEHDRLPYISYPYEWSFSLLQDAALFHLDFHLELLDRGFTLSDASAYNVQFSGPKPVFIDHLSIRRYQAGEFWLGHRQFCEQFVNPLLLRALFGVAHNAWYRGNVEGIPTGDLAKLLGLRHKFSWNILAHVVWPNRLQQNAGKRRDLSQVRKQGLPLSAFRAMLGQMRTWIAAMSPDRIGATTWADYSTTNSYSSDEEEKKRRFVGETIAATVPGSVIDLGCNTGDYARVALENGAGLVIGFDFDQQALDRAHRRAKSERLNFLPLFLDAKNPSPDQGWRQAERSSYAARASHMDAVLALAFEHHLAIAHNVPLPQVVQWITSLAPTGVIEFVPKEDPVIQTMLALRDDIFPDYSRDAFEAALRSNARIERQATVSNSGRTLYAFDRRQH